MYVRPQVIASFDDKALLAQCWTSCGSSAGGQQQG